MAESQLDDIRKMEEMVRQLVRQAAEMREEADRSEDPKFRQLMMEVANGCEAAARNLEAGLRGMRQGLN
jgi:hypothetical protein